LKQNEFIPERFLDENIKFSKNYFPFGAGPRMCIGNNFAMYEMILAIIALVEQFKIIEGIYSNKTINYAETKQCYFEFKNRFD
jgi:cytochrome P450